MKTDAQLLRDYVELGIEDAFGEIVNRYTNLVYSVALRQVNTPDVAADVVQSVFFALSGSAAKLSRTISVDASLAGWLCRSALNISLKFRRDEFRRLSRERLAMDQYEHSSGTDEDWTRLSPALNDAMRQLAQSDLDALVLRFFENQDLRSVGRSLGVSDDTAQKRVSRALDKLRSILLRRGVTTTALALQTLLSANAVQTAPSGLAAAIFSATVVSKAALANTMIHAAIMSTMQKNILAAVLVIITGAGIYEFHQASTLRAQLETFQSQQEPLAQQVQDLNIERTEAAQTIAALRRENDRLSHDSLELLRLRGLTSALQAQVNKLAKPVQASGVPGSEAQTVFPRESWTFAGYASPEATLQSYMWAKTQGDVETALSTATPELKEAIKEHYFKGKSDAEISASLMADSKTQSGFRILNKMNVAADQVIFQIHFDGAPDKNYALLTINQIDGQWKVSSTEEHNDPQP